MIQLHVAFLFLLCLSISSRNTFYGDCIFLLQSGGKSNHCYTQTAEGLLCVQFMRGKTSGRAALGSSVARPQPHPGHQRSHLRWQPRRLDSNQRWPGLSKDLSAPWRGISHLLSLASPSPTINSVSVSPVGLHILVSAATTDAAQMVS